MLLDSVTDLLDRGGPNVIQECRRCGTSVEADVDECPNCGPEATLVQYEFD